jgi:putative FmdB family regulatory protein
MSLLAFASQDDEGTVTRRPIRLWAPRCRTSLYRSCRVERGLPVHFLLEESPKRKCVVPTYEYECQQCHQRVEAVQSFSDEPLTICESCGGELRKVFSGVGIAFKGSGFYKTDNRPSSSD